MRWKEIITEDKSLLDTEVEPYNISPLTVRPKPLKFDVAKGPLAKKDGKKAAMGDQQFKDNPPETVQQI